MRLADSFFGSIALKNRMLTREQLAEALRVQWERAQGGIGPELGAVCVQLGFLTAGNVTQVVQAQLESELLLEETLLGRIAVHNGILGEAELKSALEEQKTRGPGARLGHILIERSNLTVQQVHALLTSQRRMKQSGQIVEALKEPKGPAKGPAKPARRRRRSRSALPDGQLPAEGRCWDNDAVRIARLTSGSDLDDRPPTRKRARRKKKAAPKRSTSARKAKAVAAKPAAGKTSKKAAKKAVKKPAKTSAKKPAKKVAKKVAKKPAKKAAKKPAKKPTKKVAKKVARKVAKKTVHRTTRKTANRG